MFTNAPGDCATVPIQGLNLVGNRPDPGFIDDTRAYRQAYSVRPLGRFADLRHLDGHIGPAADQGGFQPAGARLHESPDMRAEDQQTSHNRPTGGLLRLHDFNWQVKFDFACLLADEPF